MLWHREGQERLFRSQCGLEQLSLGYLPMQSEKTEVFSQALHIHSPHGQATPGADWMMPRKPSALVASRMAIRLAPNCTAISCSVGSRSPGFSFLLIIKNLIFSITSSLSFFSGLIHHWFSH